MNRDYSTAPAPSSLSRNSSNVSWGTKIKGAIQIGHGVGEAIRGSLGATDLGPHNYTPSREIAQRGRHEIAQGLARIKGVPTMLPPAPVYDRRHSYPLQQYEQQPASAWGRRSTSAHQNRQNPPTTTSPFDKFYEHPYPAEQNQDPGFAGLGAGADAGRRKEGNDRIMPAFVVSPPQTVPTSETPYPSFTRQSVPGTPRSSQVSSVHYQSGIPPNSTPTSSRSSIAPPLPPRNPLNSPLYGPTPVLPSGPAPVDNRYLSVSSSIPHNSPVDSSSTGPQPPSNRRRSLSSLVDRTSKNIRLNGKGKAKEKQPEGTGKLGRIQSMFLASGRRSISRPSSPTTETLDNEHHSSAAHYRTRSTPSTPPPHRHESALETAGYDVLSYDVKDAYPHWPTEEEMGAGSHASRARSQTGGRLEPVRSVRG
ncbi:hypothetical protein DFH09DRAFT_1366084 [Mycena vulgaris]|nr:hypothetical protein DFH09DRAFT_1222070 [Mycena vulgaris]KAJ6554059.1 hypothetical protein DFH09DRAFT_1366084 [Mycena vulgaris]